jgi:hypothetical protein
MIIKPIMWIALFLVLNVGVVTLSSAGNAGENKNSNATSSHKKATEKNGAQWSADPERGWVRADKRRQSSDSDRVPRDNRYDGKQKSKGKANKS